MSIGNSSRRPASISKISTIFDSGDINPKFAVGPTSSSPGPMLFIVATTDVNVVIRSFPSRLMSRREAMKSTVYDTI